MTERQELIERLARHACLLECVDEEYLLRADWRRQIVERFAELVADHCASYVENQIHHAELNGHVLDRNSQGIRPGEKVPAVRAENVRAATEGVRRMFGAIE